MQCSFDYFMCIDILATRIYFVNFPMPRKNIDILSVNICIQVDHIAERESPKYYDLIYLILVSFSYERQKLFPIVVFTLSFLPGSWIHCHLDSLQHFLLISVNIPLQFCCVFLPVIHVINYPVHFAICCILLKASLSDTSSTVFALYSSLLRLIFHHPLSAEKSIFTVLVVLVV